MNVVRLKPRRHRELDTAEAEVGKALVTLVERHGVLEVTTILVRFLAEIIVRVRARHNVDCDEWLEGLRRQFNGAMGSGRRRLWLALVAFLAACAHPPPLVYRDTVIPPRLVEPICDSALGGRFSMWHSDGNLPTHWEGIARWRLDAAGNIRALDCDVVGFEHGWPDTFTARALYEDWIGTPLDAFLNSVDKLRQGGSSTVETARKP